jgi:hypothetical protein
MLHLVDGEIPPACAVRVCPGEGDIAVTVGPITPLDDTMLDRARESIRPGGRATLCRGASASCSVQLVSSVSPRNA